MKITLETGSPMCPVLAPSWERLQKMISSCFADNRVRLTSIERVDGGASYRAMGVYQLRMTVYHERGVSEELFATLTVAL